MTESPKALFILSHKDSATTLSQIVQDRPLRLAVVFAMSQLVFNGATKEQLDGAKLFATALMTLGDPIQPVPTFPSKEIKHL